MARGRLRRRDLLGLLKLVHRSLGNSVLASIVAHVDGAELPRLDPADDLLAPDLQEFGHLRWREERHLVDLGVVERRHFTPAVSIRRPCRSWEMKFTSNQPLFAQGRKCYDAPR